MVLLDTHTLLWALSSPENLSANAMAALDADDRCVSIASLWEIAIKSSLADPKRRLVLETSVLDISEECERQGIELLPITPEDCAKVATLPHHHVDPFDRLIVAQALTRGLAIITRDGNIGQYEGVTAIW